MHIAYESNTDIAVYFLILNAGTIVLRVSTTPRLKKVLWRTEKLCKKVS